ncbi:MBL fold metallo-hydrolase [Moheibacter stercoris]|uniref:L-ascorbate metabolism protein UlaG (Beta-lactamase superfamily) n=1 Tax=Moheibacter stercoris TaxID=1628251 RepID=A0ABV2LX39_9FLAO
MKKKIWKKMLIGLGIFLLLFLGGVFAYMQHPKFGKSPSGDRLKRMEQSKNYRDGQFHNLSETPALAEGTSVWKIYYDFLFKSFPNSNPIDSIPSVKNDLKNLKPEENVFVWFGHSSYFIQLNGKKYLIDPVLSGNASPVAGTNKSFAGSEMYTVEDLPEIDYLLITHDHYDHLDYETILQLKPKVKKVITALGVGAHLEYWGFKPENLTELDWKDFVEFENNIKLTAVPARHFSGRTFKRNATLWTSFVLEVGEMKIFIGGDSGYDPYFELIGEEFGPFDWAILENGQYNEKWKYIHFLPNETVQAAKDLKAKKVIPVHNSKFKLAQHAWWEPLDKFTEEAQKQNLNYATPKIGELVNLNDSLQNFTKWWKDLK